MTYSTTKGKDNVDVEETGLQPFKLVIDPPRGWPLPNFRHQFEILFIGNVVPEIKSIADRHNFRDAVHFKSPVSYLQS